MEMVSYIFTECQRLQELFGQLRELCGRLEMVFSLSFFVFGPGYSFPHSHKFCLVNNFVWPGQACRVVDQKESDSGEQANRSTDGFQGVCGGTNKCGAAQLRNDWSSFPGVWCMEKAVCSCTKEGLAVHLTGVGKRVRYCRYRVKGSFWFCLFFGFFVFHDLVCIYTTVQKFGVT